MRDLNFSQQLDEELSPWNVCPVDWRLDLLMDYSEDADIKLFRNFFTSIPVYTASYTDDSNVCKITLFV
jgi:hypothetical protein